MHLSRDPENLWKGGFRVFAGKAILFKSSISSSKVLMKAHISLPYPTHFISTYLHLRSHAHMYV
jgi:hypothetical protein